MGRQEQFPRNSRISRKPPIFGAKTQSEMDIFIYRIMDFVVYQILGHRIVIGSTIIPVHWSVLDKRTTHASGTPPYNVNTYYAYFSVYIFIEHTYSIVRIFIDHMFTSKYHREPRHE